MFHFWIFGIPKIIVIITLLFVLVQTSPLKVEKLPLANKISFGSFPVLGKHFRQLTKRRRQKVSVGQHNEVNVTLIGLIDNSGYLLNWSYQNEATLWKILLHVNFLFYHWNEPKTFSKNDKTESRFVASCQPVNLSPAVA